MQEKTDKGYRKKNLTNVWHVWMKEVTFLKHFYIYISVWNCTTSQCNLHFTIQRFCRDKIMLHQEQNGAMQTIDCCAEDAPRWFIYGCVGRGSRTGESAAPESWSSMPCGRSQPCTTSWARATLNGKWRMTPAAGPGSSPSVGMMAVRGFGGACWGVGGQVVGLG